MAANNRLPPPRICCRRSVRSLPHRTSRPQKARTARGRKTTTAEVTSYCRKEVRKLTQRLVRTSHFRLNCRVDDLAKPAPGGAVHWFRAIFNVTLSAPLPGAGRFAYLVRLRAISLTC